MPGGILTRRCFLRGALAAVASGVGGVGLAHGALKAGDRPKRVTLSDLKGESVAFPDAYEGKVLLAHFWASWCPQCLTELDALEALFSQYNDRGFVPVSVNVGETRAVVTDSLRNRKVTHPILFDPDAATARAYGVTGLPTTFLLDRAGAIALKVLGGMDPDGLRRILVGRL